MLKSSAFSLSIPRRDTLNPSAGYVGFLRTPVLVAVAPMPYLCVASQVSALLLGIAGPVNSAADGTASTASAPAETIPNYNWFPGYYVLNYIDTAVSKQAILDDPLVEPFTGVQFRYHWAASELLPGDYSAGFATLDADLERVA